MTNYLRPDELATNSEIERAKRRTGEIRSSLETASSIGATGLGLTAAKNLGSKIVPFLNEFITPDLALKGIKKVAPQVGKFLDQGLKQGLNLKDGLNFLKENFSKQTENKAPDQRNILEQYSPELFSFVKDLVGKGQNPIVAALQATENKQFKNIIKKIESDHKTPFSSIIQSIFGGGQEVQQKLPKQDQQVNQPQQPQQNQPGPGQQALMQELQRIRQLRGG